MILSNGRRLHTVRALTFVDILRLDREALFDLLEVSNFELIAHRIRRATIRLAVQRWFRFVGKLVVRKMFAFRATMTHEETLEARASMIEKYRTNKSAVDGNTLDWPALVAKFDMLTALLPPGTCLFPPQPELSETATTLEAVGLLQRQLQLQCGYMQSCMELMATQLNVPVPKMPTLPLSPRQKHLAYTKMAGGSSSSNASDVPGSPASAQNVVSPYGNDPSRRHQRRVLLSPTVLEHHPLAVARSPQRRLLKSTRSPIRRHLSAHHTSTPGRSLQKRPASGAK